MMDFAFKMMDFAFKMMDFVSKKDDLMLRLPLRATVESIGVITFRPSCDVMRYELGTGRNLLLLPSAASSKL